MIQETAAFPHDAVEFAALPGPGAGPMEWLIRGLTVAAVLLATTALLRVLSRRRSKKVEQIWDYSELQGWYSGLGTYVDIAAADQLQPWLDQVESDVEPDNRPELGALSALLVAVRYGGPALKSEGLGVYVIAWMNRWEAAE